MRGDHDGATHTVDVVDVDVVVVGPGAPGTIGRPQEGGSPADDAVRIEPVRRLQPAHDLLHRVVVAAVDGDVVAERDEAIWTYMTGSAVVAWPDGLGVERAASSQVGANIAAVCGDMNRTPRSSAHDRACRPSCTHPDVVTWKMSSSSHSSTRSHGTGGAGVVDEPVCALGTHGVRHRCTSAAANPAEHMTSGRSVRPVSVPIASTVQLDGGSGGAGAGRPTTAPTARRHGRPLRAPPRIDASSGTSHGSTVPSPSASVPGAPSGNIAAQVGGPDQPSTSRPCHLLDTRTD